MTNNDGATRDHSAQMRRVSWILWSCLALPRVHPVRIERVPYLLSCLADLVQHNPGPKN